MIERFLGLKKYLNLMTIKLMMYCFLVYFTADNIFGQIFNIYKTNHGNNLIFGTRITKAIFQNNFKKFNCENPLKSMICSTFIMKLAVNRAIRVVFTKQIFMYNVNYHLVDQQREFPWRIFSSKTVTDHLIINLHFCKKICFKSAATSK